MNDELIYQEHLIPMTRQELIKHLRAALRDKRFEHVLRVEQTAIELAK